MIPCDWIGIVTIRNEIRCSTSTNGMMIRKPGCAFTDHPAQPEQHTILVLLDDPQRHRRAAQQHYGHGNKCDDHGGHGRARLESAGDVQPERAEGDDEAANEIVMVILVLSRSPACQGSGANTPRALQRTAELFPRPAEVLSHHQRYTRWIAPADSGWCTAPIEAVDSVRGGESLTADEFHGKAPGIALASRHRPPRCAG